MINLSVIERRMLANQYRILRAVAPEEAAREQYDELIDILEGGFEAQYRRIVGSLQEDRLSVDDCALVNHVLLMASWMRQQAATTTLDLDEFRIIEFGETSEANELAYAKFLYRANPDGYPGIEDIVPSNQGGHLDRYRRMVAAWAECKDGPNVGDDELTRIIVAGGHPTTDRSRG